MPDFCRSWLRARNFRSPGRRFCNAHCVRRGGEVTDRSDINDAILLFQYSNTALAGGRAATVVRFLRQLQQAGEIGFANLGRPSLHGTWLQGRAGFDLQLNSQYPDSPPQANRPGGLRCCSSTRVCTQP